VLWTAEEFSTFAPRALTDAEIQKIRALRSTLFRQWSAIAPGEKLKLKFGP
jgi:hypothetical protein